MNIWMSKAKKSCGGVGHRGRLASVLANRIFRRLALNVALLRAMTEGHIDLLPL